jgi:hypothetical protein
MQSKSYARIILFCKKTEAHIIRASHPESLNILENDTAVQPIISYIQTSFIIQDGRDYVKLMY